MFRFYLRFIWINIYDLLFIDGELWMLGNANHAVNSATFYHQVRKSYTEKTIHQSFISHSVFPQA